MSLNLRMMGTWIASAVLAYFIVTAPVQAAELTHRVLGRIGEAAHSGVLFLQHLST